MNLTINKVSPEDLAAIKALGGAGSGNFGHRGRPGKVGGSGNGSGYGVGRPLESLYPSDDHKAWAALNKLEWHKDSSNASYWKTKVSEGIADQLGEGYDAVSVSTILGSWSSSSNDTDLRSLSLQKAASDEFGIEMSDWQKEKYETLIITRERIIEKDSDKPGFKLEGGHLSTIEEAAFGSARGVNDNFKTRNVLRAMYNNTQAEFEASGIEYITIHRGFQFGASDLKLSDSLTKLKNRTVSYRKNPAAGPNPIGGLINTRGANALESWTTDSGIADNFSSSPNYNGGMGINLAMKIPVTRVVSTPGTGIGCLKEFEIVILPNKNDVSMATGVSLYGDKS